MAPLHVAAPGRQGYQTSPVEAMRTGKPAMAAFRPAEKVFVEKARKGDWKAAEIQRLNADGTYYVCFSEDRHFEDHVSPDKIKALTDQLHGADGMPFKAPQQDPYASQNRLDAHQASLRAQQVLRLEEEQEQGWFRSECNRLEQERLAQIHLQEICRRVDERWAAGVCPDRRWTNDPEVFPDPSLKGTVTSNGVTSFPPHDQQFYVNGIYNPATSRLRPSALPDLMMDENGNSTWMRLVDFAPCSEACHVFDEAMAATCTHFGRIQQGELDNGYFVEALQAISLRPRLARQMFYCWDVRRSIYIVRIHKHGQWVRCEVDDYVPVGPPTLDDTCSNTPICCRSENFPYVMWPSLVEKAYAKVHTCRQDTSEVSELDRGGWEVLGGGGRTEEALADLTGGIAGRFRTADVTADRLFIYIYELQRDTLFVCRVNEESCAMHGVGLNAYYPNVVNRATVFDGRCFIQMYSGAPGLFDGGLMDHGIPWGLINSAEYPERPQDGFFWITAEDFREYYSTIFECRLVSSGDVSLPGMPPPRLPAVMTDVMAGAMPGAMSAMPPGMAGAAATAMPWREEVWANPGRICAENEPEISITVPEEHCPCEVVVSVEQIDPRMRQTSGLREEPAALLVKVYESVGGGFYSMDMVCKSNWFTCRDNMVAFCAQLGGEYRVVVEFPRGAHVNRMIVRIASQKPNVMATVSTATVAHDLVVPDDPPKAMRWTFVGHVRQERYDRGQLAVNKPEEIDIRRDCLRKPEFDLQPGIEELSAEIRKDCAVM